MVSVGPKHMAAFIIGTDGALYRKYKDEENPDTTWTGWAREGGIWILDPVVAVRAPYEANIFMINTSHALQHSTFNFMEGHGIGPWRNVGGKLSSPPAVTPRKGTLHIFQIGSDHVLYHKSWDGTKYTPQDKYEELGGLFIYSPAAVSAGAEEVSVFAVGLADGRLHHYNWKSNSGWQHPEEGGGFLGLFQGKLPGSWAGTPSAISTKDGSWDVFGVNSKGQINHLSYHDGKLSELETISGQVFQTIDAISVAPGTIDLIGWGIDSGVHHKTWNGKTWGEWEDLNGGVAHRPTPVSHSPGALSVIAVGSNCIMYIKVRDPKTGKWGNWADIQGVVVSRVA